LDMAANDIELDSRASTEGIEVWDKLENIFDLAKDGIGSWQRVVKFRWNTL
jgi:hypothetical protein